MKPLSILVVIGAAAASAAFCETLVMNWGDRLTTLDSEAPGEVVDEFGLEPGPLGRSIAFDPVTRELWAFEHGVCQVTCPPAQDALIIDPITGGWDFVPLPGLDLALLVLIDPDIEPGTQEIRYFDYRGGNFSYSLVTRQLRVDQPLNQPFSEISAVAHRTAPGGGVETYVIGHLMTPDAPAATGSWLELARIGGPDGNPPASSGEVTVIGPIDVIAERMAFDIAEDGTAYLATMWSLDPDNEDNKLYRVDLESGAVELLGVIEPPVPGYRFGGMAVPPPGFGAGAVAIPALSRWGLLSFAALLVGAASVCLRRGSPATALTSRS